MANPYTSKVAAAVMPTDFGQQQEEIQRQKRMAEMLEQQGMEPLQGQTVSGIYVAPSWTQQLAKGLSPFLASKQRQSALEKEKDLARQMGEERTSTLQKFSQLLRGTSESDQGQMYPAGGNPDEQGGMGYRPAVAPNRNAAYAALLQSRDPILQQLGIQQQLKDVESNQSLFSKIDPKDYTQESIQKFAQTGDFAVLSPVRKTEKPVIRERLIGDQMIQEQLQADGSYQEIGRGPRFARQVAPVVSVGAGSSQGKPPMGYRFTPAGDLEAIPGGPADQKRQGLLNADTASAQSAESGLNRLAEFANSLKNMPGLKGITGLRGAIPNIPGSEAANAQAQLETLKSQVAFGVLQAMRDASKTGGALGAVSEKELGLLQNNLAALDRAQSYEQFQKALDQIISYTGEAKGRIRSAYNIKYSDKAAPTATATPTASKGGFKIIGVE